MDDISVIGFGLDWQRLCPFIKAITPLCLALLICERDGGREEKLEIRINHCSNAEWSKKWPQVTIVVAQYECVSVSVMTIPVFSCDGSSGGSHQVGAHYQNIWGVIRKSVLLRLLFILMVS